MGLAAVRVQVAGDGFFLLAEQNSAASAAELKQKLEALLGSGGTLRLRPRTAPDNADWVREGALARLYPGGEAAASLTGEESPGTAWRDILGSSIQSVEVVDLSDPTPLWHWAIGAEGEREVG